MEERRNPFNPGAGARPPALVGRESELEDFDIAADRLGAGLGARSLLLTGLRGVGKTVLLREFGRIADGKGWACGRTEAAGSRSFPAEMARLAQSALVRLSGGRPWTGGRAGRWEC